MDDLVAAFADRCGDVWGALKDVAERSLLVVYAIAVLFVRHRIVRSRHGVIKRPDKKRQLQEAF